MSNIDLEVSQGNSSQDNEIRTWPCPECYLCGAPGKPLYQGLQDRHYNTAGWWNLKQCSNLDCGLAWLDPMPLAEDIGKAYRNYFTHRDREDVSHSIYRRLRRSGYRFLRDGYLKSKYGYPISGCTKFKSLLSFLLYLLPPHRSGIDISVMRLSSVSDGRLLDVGCGNGDLLNIMQGLGWKAEGVDFDPVAVEVARKNSLTVKCGKMQEQSYPDNYFEAITMSHFIEHVHDPKESVRECHRILKPGGRLIVVTPNIGSLGHSLFRSSWRDLDPPRHLHIFSLKSFRHLAEDAGFKKFKLWTTFQFAHIIFIASRNIKTRGFIGSEMGSEPRSIRLWGRKMQLLEWAALKKSPELGEEIIFEGTK
jgi:2-polyprenyl-3-methyl-5-hydroxy-6-metoxy-1,4-benzoquinol methylase